MHLIDSHCHLDFPQFKKDFDMVIKKAEEAGVKKFLNPGCNLATSREAVDLANKFENIYAAVGVHPHDAKEISIESIHELESLVQNKKVVAIGEIGLDYFRMRNTKEVQIEAFRSQIELAKKLNKPVIIHSRDADEDIFKVLDNFLGLKGVFHCFGGDWGFAEKVLARGFLIGLTGIVTFSSAKNTHEVAKKTSLKKLLIETDAPFLAPQKFRGQRCEPAYVKEVVERIAELKGISVEKVAEATTKNAKKMFSI